MARLRVLILEDDSDIVDLIRSVLEPSMECCMAANGLEGLQQVELAEPDFCVCDIMMPVMDGNEFIKRVHRIPPFEGLPVIFLSALSSSEKIKEGYTHGAALYLTKPIDPGRLKRNIELFVHDREIEPRPRRHGIEEVHRLSRFPEADETTAQRMKATGASAKAAPATPAATPATPASPAPEKPMQVPPPPKPVQGSMGAVMSNVQRYNQTYGKENSGQNDRVRILVVEDDRDTCQMLRLGLGDKYDVLETNDGINAIEAAVRYKPDIFIVDGMLPRMTGYQLAVMLKKNRDFFRAPLIFTSGKATQRDQQYVQKLGITQFLPKPFTIAAMDQILTQVVKAPGFTVKRDRLPFNQVNLEQLHQFEVNRPKHTTLDQLEKQGLENALKKQLN